VFHTPLVVAALAPLLWLIASLTFPLAVRVKEKNQFLRLAIALVVVGIFISITFYQIDLYRSIAHVRDSLEHDAFFMTLFLGEWLIAYAIMMAFAMQDIAKDRQPGKPALTPAQNARISQGIIFLCVLFLVAIARELPSGWELSDTIAMVGMVIMVIGLVAMLRWLQKPNQVR